MTRDPADFALQLGRGGWRPVFFGEGPKGYRCQLRRSVVDPRIMWLVEHATPGEPPRETFIFTTAGQFEVGLIAPPELRGEHFRTDAIAAVAAHVLQLAAEQREDAA